MTFTPAEAAYLNEQPIGRLCTIGPAGEPQVRPIGVHLGPDGTTIDVVGHALARTQKWRNVIRNPRVAFIVDNVISVSPPEARGIEIRGIAEVLPGRGATEGGLSGDIIRITPEGSWLGGSTGTAPQRATSTRLASAVAEPGVGGVQIRAQRPWPAPVVTRVAAASIARMSGMAVAISPSSAG